jgi:hypothetical protein
VHGHSSPEFPDDASTLRLRATPRVALAAALLIAALATVWGVVQLWPGSYHPASSASGAYASPGVIFPPATVLTVQPPCPQPAVNPSGGADGTPFCHQPRSRRAARLPLRWSQGRIAARSSR